MSYFFKDEYSVTFFSRSVYSDTWSSEKDVDVSSIDDIQERVTYTMPQTLKAGSKTDLKINFAGVLTGNMMGYYRSRWETEGTTQYYSLTQFEVCVSGKCYS